MELQILRSRIPFRTKWFACWHAWATHRRGIIWYCFAKTNDRPSWELNPGPDMGSDQLSYSERQFVREHSTLAEMLVYVQSTWQRKTFYSYGCTTLEVAVYMLYIYGLSVGSTVKYFMAVAAYRLRSICRHWHTSAH